MSGPYYVGYLVVSEEEEVTSLADVRKIAADVPAVKEFYVNDVSKVVSYKNTEHNCRINVYYTTGTVGTCLLHPVAGKTQLFRRDVTAKVLRKIFLNPRTHTGKGYFTKDRMPDVFNLDLVPSEEEALTEQLSVLEPQVQLIKARLAEIERERLLAAQKKVQALQAKQELLRKKAEAEARAAAAVEAERVARTQREALAKQKVESAANARRVNQRGNNSWHNLDFGRHVSMSDVTCVAMSGDGYAILYDNGYCESDGLSDEVERILDNQKHSNIAYIALGEQGQYYIRKKNGRAFFSGPEEFEEDIRGTVPKFIAFGDWHTYYIKYENEEAQCNSDLYNELPDSVLDSLMCPGYGVTNVWLGLPDYYGHLPYFVVYAGGYIESEYLPDHIEDWLCNKKSSTKVKQLLCSVGSYFIRYS